MIIELEEFDQHACMVLKFADGSKGRTKKVAPKQQILLMPYCLVKMITRILCICIAAVVQLLIWLKTQVLASLLTCPYKSSIAGQLKQTSPKFCRRERHEFSIYAYNTY